MIEYPKIQSLYKRNEKGQMILGQYSLPEFEYLANNTWWFTEKVDGTNIRIIWRPGMGRTIGGKTDAAQIPTFLLEELIRMFPEDKMQETFKDPDGKPFAVCLYGEGYGAKIQKGGGNYKPDGVSFVLFDVLVDKWWLKHDAILNIAEKLNIGTVPDVGIGTLHDMVNMVKTGFGSQWGTFTAEGIVARPTVELHCRNGHRVITKLKHKDFKNIAE